MKSQKLLAPTNLAPLSSQINSQTKTINTSVQSELNIIANITDNQAIYRCEAQNSATDVPLLDSKTLSVHCEYSYFLSHDFTMRPPPCIAHNFPPFFQKKRTQKFFSKKNEQQKSAEILIFD
jgi:hypothetical protein